MQNNEASEKMTPEEAREHAETAQQFRDVRKHLKSQSKNQLVLTVLQLMGALMESQRINKFLNESLKETLPAADAAEKKQDA